MSLLEFSSPSGIVQRRFALAIWGLVAASMLLLAGCSFQPLHGQAGTGAGLSDKLKSVAIAPIPGRAGQKLRNELIFKLTGGGKALPSKYKLTIVVRESVGAILVKQTGDAEGQVYVLTADFKLVRTKDQVEVFKGSGHSRASFDKFNSIFANTRARIDAENRAAQTISETIKRRLSAFLSRPT